MTSPNGSSPDGSPRFVGAITALVTPFGTDGSLDEAAFRRLVEIQCAAGIDGLLPCGTTGESPTLSEGERDTLVAAAVEIADRRLGGNRPAVIAGTGTNDTAASIRLTKRAAQLGADAALIVAPYYNKPDGRMMDAHFRAIADEGGLPVVVYNVPGRTASNIEADVFLRMAQHPRIVAVKEASANLEQIARICRDRPEHVTVLSGDDAWTLAVLAMGGHGVISVCSNEIPAEMTALCAAGLAGDFGEALRLHERFLPLMLGNFKGGPNPVPVKAAMQLLGLIEDDTLRQPLLPLEEKARAGMAAALREVGLIDEAGQPTSRSLAGAGTSPSGAARA
jgi:4-hydroxy-tetrahydrodipicolinate synthase